LKKTLPLEMIQIILDEFNVYNYRDDSEQYFFDFKSGSILMIFNNRLNNDIQIMLSPHILFNITFNIRIRTNSNYNDNFIEIDYTYDFPRIQIQTSDKNMDKTVEIVFNIYKMYLTNGKTMLDMVVEIHKILKYEHPLHVTDERREFLNRFRIEFPDEITTKNKTKK
jgi:hypothetical protein